jgi:hypothetical protein
LQFAAQKPLRPLIPQLLDALLKMLDEIDHEELLKTLNRLVEYYSEDVTSHATKVAHKVVCYLSQSFLYQSPTRSLLFVV